MDSNLKRLRIVEDVRCRIKLRECNGDVRTVECSAAKLGTSNPEDPANRVDFRRAHRAGCQPAKRVDRLQRDRRIAAGSARVTATTRRDHFRRRPDRAIAGRANKHRVSRQQRNGDRINMKRDLRDADRLHAATQRQQQTEKRDCSCRSTGHESSPDRHRKTRATGPFPVASR